MSHIRWFSSASCAVTFIRQWSETARSLRRRTVRSRQRCNATEEWHRKSSASGDVSRLRPADGGLRFCDVHTVERTRRSRAGRPGRRRRLVRYRRQIQRSRSRVGSVSTSTTSAHLQERRGTFHGVCLNTADHRRSPEISRRSAADLSHGDIFNDLEWPLTWVSRSRDNYKSNISKTVHFRYIVTTEH